MDFSCSSLWFQINSCKHISVHYVVNSTFPAIKSTDNKPTVTPAVTPKTVGYIHSDWHVLVIDTLTRPSIQVLSKLRMIVH